MSKYQILSNILYQIEYPSDYTGGSAGYPTFSIAYLVYSTTHKAVPYHFLLIVLIAGRGLRGPTL